MIRIHRGPEPPELTAARNEQLPLVRAIAATRQPRSQEISEYQVARPALVDAQEHKCCYCEKLIEGPYDDVEHLRPKGRADRGPGFPTTGYWWLAWTWANLLVACNSCNRTHKGTRFPLATGSTVLAAEDAAPGGELPLLLDPGAEDPIEHIQFVPTGGGHWRPIARRGSRRGDRTIRDVGLDRPTLLDLYHRHVDRYVRTEAESVHEAIGAGNRGAVHERWRFAHRRLLRRCDLFAALSYDALAVLVPAPAHESWALELPRPPIP